MVPTSSMNQPDGIAADGSGNLYIVDSENGRVVKETLSGSVYTESTIASGFTQVSGIAVDASGNVYFADSRTGRLLKETLSGNTYTQSVVLTSATIGFTGLAVDLSNNIYIADGANHQVLKETLSGGTYTESIIGSGMASPQGVAVDGSGNVYVTDTANNRVLKETLSGGSYTQSEVASNGLAFPWGIAVDGSGNVFITDPGNRRALKETPSNGTYSQSVIPTSLLVNALGIAVDANDNVYIAQNLVNSTTSVLKELAPTSTIDFGPVNVGSLSSQATLFFTFDSAGTMGTPAVLTQGVSGLDFANPNTGNCTATTYSAGATCTISVTFSPRVPGLRSGAAVLSSSTGSVIATSYIRGTGLGPQVNFQPSTQSTLSLSNVVSPYAIAEDAAGNLYIAKAVSANSPQNAVVKETWTGNGYTQSTVATGLAYPVGVAVDGAGNVFIADQDAMQVLKETPTSGGGYAQTAAFTGLGTVESVAVDGSGNVYIGSLLIGLLKETLTSTGYVQSVISAGVYPNGIAVDGAGNIYLGQSGSQLFKETLANGSYTQSTIASGLNTLGLTVDGMGNLYVADTGSGQLVKLTVSGSSYIQSSVASLTHITGVAADGNGDVFASSAEGNSVLKVDLVDPPSLNFATTNSGSTSDAQTVTLVNIGNAPLSFPIPTSGNNPSISTNFTLNSTGSTACPLVGSTSTAGTLAAGVSCQLPISFAPTIGGNISGALAITDTSLNAATPNYAVQSIALSGMALEVPTLSFAVIPAQTYGNAPFTVSAASASSGAVTYAVVSGPATITGSTVTLTGVGTVVLNVSQAASGNYAPATATISFTVAAQTFTLASSSGSSSATTTAGGTVNYTLTLTPGSGTTFPNAITFGATGLPTGATATFSPATLAAGSGVTSITLTVQTSSQTARNEKPSQGMPVAPLELGLLLLPLAGMKSARKRLRQIPFLLATLTVATLSLGAVMGLSGCSGGGSGSSTPTAKNYTVVVTATDAITKTQSSTNLTLTVQ
jgi:streptogramin lyase